MKSQRAEHKIPGARTPGTDISLVKSNLGVLSALLSGDSKGRLIDIYCINGDWNLSVPAPKHKFPREIPLAGCQIENTEKRGCLTRI